MQLKAVLIFGLLSSSAAKADQIWLPSASKQVQPQVQTQSLDHLIDQSTIVVLGENHYDPATVAVEAKVAARVAQKSEATLGWEFLNIIDKDLVASVVERLKSAAIDTETALTQLFPNQTAPVEYSAILDLVAQNDLNLIPTNLTRAQKTPVTKGGLEAAPEGLLPPDFELGSANYFALFQEAMGPHPLPSPIENYFASQSLTDDVMAYALLGEKSAKKVLVTGAFHGDYREGVVQRLVKRAPKEKVLYIKIINANDYTAEEIQELLVDPTYGPIADVLYVVEPKEVPADESL